MKLIWLLLASACATIVKVIHCKCTEVEDTMQSTIDMTEGRYITHSFIYNPLLGTCDVAITFKPTPTPFLERFKYVPPK